VKSWQIPLNSDYTEIKLEERTYSALITLLAQDKDIPDVIKAKITKLCLLQVDKILQGSQELKSLLSKTLI
jgi:hypothetical protein